MKNLRSSQRIMVFLSCMVLLLCLMVTGCSTTQGQPVELMVSLAPSLKGSVEEIKGLYSAANPQVKLVFNYGPSGSLQNQIEQGAAADIFISQGKEQMDALEQKGLIKQDTRVNLLSDELVLIVGKNNTTTIEDFADLSKTEVKKIGIGVAESVPAAKIAKETLTTLKLWDALQPKLVMGKDLTQVLTYVESGDADAGFVWDTIAKTSDKVKVAVTASKGSHSPIYLPAAVVTASKNSDEASKFLKYLQGDEAMRIFSKHGFVKPE